MKAFTFGSEDFIRLVPAKRMFQSTMVHDVVNRGDIFAMRVRDQQFTVIPGDAEVKHWEARVLVPGQETVARVHSQVVRKMVLAEMMELVENKGYTRQQLIDYIAKELLA